MLTGLKASLYKLLAEGSYDINITAFCGRILSCNLDYRQTIISDVLFLEGRMWGGVREDSSY
jgi:hypothetical protein